MSQSATVEETLYIRVRGKVQGPFTLEEIRAMVRRGQFSRLHEVSSDRTHWTRGSNRPDLFPTASKLSAAEALAAEVLAEPVKEDIPLEPVQPNLDSLTEREDSPASGGSWYFTQNQQQRGPVELYELTQLVRSGAVTGRDLAWTDGMAQWTAIDDLRHYFPEASLSATAGYTAGQPGAGGAAGTRTSGLAIASLVLGLLGWTFLPVLGSLLAVVLGHVAMREIRRSKGAVTGSGMATAGLVIGYFVLILAVLALVALLIVAISAALRDVQ